MNLVKHMSSNTTDRACLAYTRQSAFDKRQSLPRVSYTSTMKQIMGCYHLHIERTQTVRKKSSVGNDRPLSLICLLCSSSFSEAGPQALPSVLTSVHGPACVLLVVVPGPSPLCSLCVTTTPSSFVMYSGSSLGFFFSRTKGSTRPPARRQPLLHPVAESSLHTGCTPSYRGTYQLSAAVPSASRAHTESPNMSARGALTCTELTGVVCA